MLPQKVHDSIGKKLFLCVQAIRKNFFFSEKGQVKSLKELTENLKRVLRQLKNYKTVIRSSAERNFPIAISQNKVHEEKHRLKILSPKEVDKLLKKKQIFSKKKNLMKIKN